jgi:hypothetical protein
LFKTGKSLLNEPTSHDRNVRHIFFKPNVLWSCQQKSIMQYNMCNQCSGLFICIMNYLYILCIIFMVLSCVLCMTLMMFIYVYYGLFAYTNLVVMSLFFMVFSLYLSIFDKNWPVFDTNRPKIIRRFSEKPADLSVKPIDLSVFSILLFLYHLRYVSTNFFNFYRFLLKFSKTHGIDKVRRGFAEFSTTASNPSSEPPWCRTAPGPPCRRGGRARDVAAERAGVVGQRTRGFEAVATCRRRRLARLNLRTCAGCSGPPPAPDLTVRITGTMETDGIQRCPRLCGLGQCHCHWPSQTRNYYIFFTS